MFRSSISPSLLQSVLDSASNAATKGQAQYFTPIELAQSLASLLPHTRPVIIDLTCGNGQLLAGAANSTTTHILGCDIDPCGGDSATGERGARKNSSFSSPPPPSDFCPPSSALRSPPSPPSPAPPVPPLRRVVADLPLLYPLLADVDFLADLFVLNPPWDLHWSKDRLASLAESHINAVAQAFAATDPRLGSSKIDSTIATLMIALDRSTWLGEGLLIANASTMERLIFAPGAPYAPLATHIWYRLNIAGNPMIPSGRGIHSPGPSGRPASPSPSSSPPICHLFPRLRDHLSFPPSPTPPHAPVASPPFTTCVLYFAASHQIGPPPIQSISSIPALRSFSEGRRLTHRQGGAVDYLCDTNTQTLSHWKAATTEYQAAHQPTRTDYNLWLDPTGHIATHLSLYQELTLSKAEAEEAKGEGENSSLFPRLRDHSSLSALSSDLCPPSSVLSPLSFTDLLRQLHSLRGKRPMQLVLQRAQRQALEQAAFHSPWRVQPELQQAIKDAIRAYHQDRAPLYPLSPTQRLGYLDESDTITCIREFTLNPDLVPHSSWVIRHSSFPSPARTAPPHPQGDAPPSSDLCPLTSDCHPLPSAPLRGLVVRGPVVPLFLPGRSYPLITRTVQVQRTATRPNNAGIDETILYTGSELAILITGENDRTICFMDARLFPQPSLASAKEGAITISDGLFPEATLQDLCAHFDIPPVPDIATLHPAQYQAHIDTLHTLETILSQSVNQ